MYTVDVYFIIWVYGEIMINLEFDFHDFSAFFVYLFLLIEKKLKTVESVEF